MRRVGAGREVEGGGFTHWCPGCEQLHTVPPGWERSGPDDAPTFTPSVLVRGLKLEVLRGRWTGRWMRDLNGDTIPFVCHYYVRDGQLEFLGDCTHGLAGRTVTIPPIPAETPTPMAADP